VKQIPINDFGNLIGGLGVFLVASTAVAVDWSAGGPLRFLVLAVLGRVPSSRRALELALASLNVFGSSVRTPLFRAGSTT